MSAGIVLERMLPDQAGVMPPGAGTLQKQRVYIFPTRQGFTFACMLLVMLLGAINYNNSMAFVLTFFLGGLAMVCILHTYHNLAGLVLTGTTPQPVFAGETALFPVTLDNRVGYRRYAIALGQAAQGSWLKSGQRVSADNLYTDLPARHLKTVHLQIEATRRGILPLGRLRISSCFPLGLFQAWSRLETEQTCVVYPRPDGNRPLPPATMETLEDRKGNQIGTDDFIGFRKYRPGDSTRNIAWKALARGQGPLVKRFDGKGAGKLVLGWDDAGHTQNVESRLSQLCRWVLRAEQQGIHYGLAIPGVHIEPGQGEQHKHLCLRSLAGFGLA